MRTRLRILLLISAVGVAGCSRAPDASENLSDPFVAARLRENTRARELLLTQPTTQPLVRDYGLAVIDGINDANDVAGARLRLQAMAADHANPLAPWAALTLVRMDHVPSTAQIAVNYPAVRSGYDKVVHDFAGTPAADEAFVYESALWLTEKNNDDVAAALQSVNDYLTARPDSLYKSALLMVRSKMQIRLKRYDDALASAIASFDSREVDPTGLASNLANEMFNIGVMAQFDVGDFATARKFYKRFADQYPTDQRLFLVKQFLTEMTALEAETRSKGGSS